MFIEKKSKTHIAQIYVSGSLESIEQCCRRYCNSTKLCVTITPTSYVFTGGKETGAIVGIINYPKFPRCVGELLDITNNLARSLLKDTQTKSLTVALDETSYYLEGEI